MRRLYRLLGTLLVALGVAGFVQPSPLFGLFGVSMQSNLLHIASGGLTLVAAFQGISGMRAWGRIFGLMYLALGILGFVAPEMMAANTATNLLHLAVALVFLYVALIAPPKL